MLQVQSNIDDYLLLLRQTPSAMADGVKTAANDIKRDWHTEAQNIAPLDTGNLRQRIKSTVEGADIDREVVIESNAYDGSFNYAYYIHEGHMAADGKRLRTPGTVEKYLEESADKRKKEWVQWLEDDVKSELRSKGW